MPACMFTPAAWTEIDAVLGGYKILYLYLLAHASSVLAATRSELARATGLTEKQVRTGLERCMDAGWLSVLSLGGAGLRIQVLAGAPLTVANRPDNRPNTGPNEADLPPKTTGPTPAHEPALDAGLAQSVTELRGQAQAGTREEYTTILNQEDINPSLPGLTHSTLQLSNSTGRSAKKAKAKPAAKKSPVAWNPETGRIVGFEPADFARWEQAFPGTDVHAELRRAEAWQLANPGKIKQDYRKFFTNWLLRNAPKLTYERPAEKTNLPSELAHAGRGDDRPLPERVMARLETLKAEGFMATYAGEEVLGASETFLTVKSAQGPRLLRWQNVEKELFSKEPRAKKALTH